VRGSPAISHLLFADDSFFFCKANRQECEVILQILKDYERASGQQINFLKSSIQFGHEVPESARLEVQQVLGITTLGGMRTYLVVLKHRFLVFLMKGLITRSIIGLSDLLRRVAKRF